MDRLSVSNAAPALRRDDLEALVRATAADPAAFVRVAWPDVVPDAWQAAALRHVAEALVSGRPVRLAIRAGHGVGKGTLASWLIIWFVLTRPDCAGVVTANTWAQLRTKTWREVALWRQRLRPELGALLDQTAHRLSHRLSPDTWGVDAIPWSEERPEAFAGLHAEHVLVVFDEASAIPAPIWETVRGAMTTPGAMWVVLGNPTRSSGPFYEAFHRHRALWTRMRVDARWSSRVDRAEIEEMINAYGLDSDFVRVRVTGEWPSTSGAGLIARDVVDAARRRVVEDDEGTPIIMGVDVARFGDDRTVFAFRRGRDARTIPWRVFRGLDTMRVVGEVMAALNTVRPHAIAVDGVGIGAGVIDRLREQGVLVHDVQSGGAATEPHRYRNRRAELYVMMRDWLRTGAIPDSQDLADELTMIEIAYDSAGRLGLESKADMKRRGLPSPDEADALALTFAVTVPRLDLPVLPRLHGSGRDQVLRVHDVFA